MLPPHLRSHGRDFARAIRLAVSAASAERSRVVVATRPELVRLAGGRAPQVGWGCSTRAGAGRPAVLCELVCMFTESVDACGASECITR